MTSPLSGVRLIALDLDGTLLPSSKVLTDRAIGVLRDVRAAGIDVTLATGKGWNHTRRYADELGLTAPLVALEGALVARTDPHCAIHSRTLPVATVGAVHEAVAGLDVGFFYCHDLWRTRVQRNLAPWLPQIRIWDPHTDLTDHAPHGDDAPPHGAFVYHLIGPPGAIAAARSRITALALPDVDLFQGAFLDGAEQLHVRPAGTDKRTGLTHALRDLGIEPRQLLVCGDWWNDVGMMQMAGVVVAPSNAVPDVLALADHVAPGTCEDDAIAVFLADALRKL